MIYACLTRADNEIPLRIRPGSISPGQLGAADADSVYPQLNTIAVEAAVFVKYVRNLILQQYFLPVKRFAKVIEFEPRQNSRLMPRGLNRQMIVRIDENDKARRPFGGS